jgi:hypothetical protein
MIYRTGHPGSTFVGIDKGPAPVGEAAMHDVDGRRESVSTFIRGIEHTAYGRAHASEHAWFAAC